METQEEISIKKIYAKKTEIQTFVKELLEKETLEEGDEDILEALMEPDVNAFRSIPHLLNLVFQYMFDEQKQQLLHLAVLSDPTNFVRFVKDNNEDLLTTIYNALPVTIDPEKCICGNDAVPVELTDNDTDDDDLMGQTVMTCTNPDCLVCITKGMYKVEVWNDLMLGTKGKKAKKLTTDDAVPSAGSGAQGNEADATQTPTGTPSLDDLVDI